MQVFASPFHRNRIVEQRARSSRSTGAYEWSMLARIYDCADPFNFSSGCALNRYQAFLHNLWWFWDMSGRQAASVMTLAPAYGPKKGPNPRSRYARSRSQRMAGVVSRVAGPSLVFLFSSNVTIVRRGIQARPRLECKEHQKCNFWHCFRVNKPLIK